MAEYDGKIKIGIDIGTKEVKDSLQDLSKNLDAVKARLKNLDKAFSQTSDRSTFDDQAQTFDKIKASLIVLAKEYQAVSDIIKKSGSSWGSNPILENMSNSYRLQFSRILKDALEFKAKLKAQIGNSVDNEVGVELDEEKFDKFISDLMSKLSSSAEKAGKKFNITPNIDLSSIQDELQRSERSSYRIISESMNFSDLGSDIKRDFIGNLSDVHP